MVEVYTPAGRSEGKIRLGIDRLARQFPFHAAILERLKIESRPEVGTMGVTVAGDDVLLLHNPEFVLAVTADELAAVLLHEVHHVLLGHVTADPADYPDGWARTVAEEVTVNEFVSLPLPGGVITLDQFPSLPPMESTRRRYDRLKRTRKRSPISPPGTVQGDRGAGCGRSGGGSGSSRPGECRRTLDDHGVWAEARRDPARAQRVIRDVVREAVLEVGPGRLPAHLAAAFEGLGVGPDPGGDKYELQGRGRGRLDWRRQLRRSAGQALEVRPAFNRPPRRFPDLVGVLPGRRRQAARPRVMAVVDTSASMTAELLEQVDGELARLARRFTVVVVECDDAVHRAYPYRKLDSLLGRGGTDFRPPLKAAFLRKHRADLVILFTDGEGPAPAARPRTPVLWCLTPDGVSPARWGRSVWMGEP